MKNIRYIVGLLILVAVSCTTPLTEEQKNSDSVLLKQTHEYTLNSDGSVDYRYYHQRQYNSYMAFNRLYGETFVVYNPDFQTLTVKKSQTTMRDGKKVQSPDNAFNEVLPFQAANAPAFNHLREMVITHVGLEIGAVVELDYTLTSKADFLPVFAGKLMLNESSPIKDLKVIVRVPKGQALNYFILNQSPDIIFKKGVEGKFDTYTWTASNITARSNESHQLEGFVDYQTLTFSTVDLIGSMDFLKSNLTKEFASHKSMENLLKSKAKGWELVEEIKNYVANNINTYRVLPQHVGFRFRTPAEVWASNGGTEGEKAILLASLLKESGFNAELALGAYPQYLNEEVGCPATLDKYLVKIELDGETRFLQATEDKTIIPGARVIIGLSDDLSQINLEPIQKPNLNLGMKASIKISKDGAISGTANLRFSEYNKDKELLSGIPSSSFTSKEMPKEDDFTVFSVEISKGVTTEKAGDYMSFSFPSMAQGIASAHLSELPTERVTRLELPAVINESYEFTIKLPKGFVAASPAYNEVVENSFGKVMVSFEISGDEIKVNRQLVFNQCVVPIESYDNFRSLASIWMDKNLNRILVKPE